jgi:hypothetical protein
MGKIWHVWFKGLECLVMGELKLIRVWNFKFFVVEYLPPKYKEIL